MYDAKDAIRNWIDRDRALDGLVRDYLDDLAEHPNASRVALAHRRVDVHAINLRIREARKTTRQLSDGENAEEATIATRDGERAFAPGDRFVFLENNRDMGVMNGMLGTVRAVSADRIDVQLDDAGADQTRSVSVDVGIYNAFDHGYALTIHKTQGATVDRAFVFASGTMDRHLTYVAMTRHREAATLYVDRQEFANHAALVNRLGRDGSKETTLDYVEAFKARRGIGGMIDRAIERVKALEIPKRVADAVDVVRSRVMTQRPVRPAVVSADKPYRDALDRFAIAHLDVARMDGKAAIYQTARLDKAGQDLDRVKPGSLATLQSALKHNLDTRVATAELRGDKRVDVLASAIENERAAILDPVVRAGRFVHRWNAELRNFVVLQDDYRRHQEREHVERNLRGMTKELDADKPMLAAIQAEPERFNLHPQSPLAQAMREQHPVYALQIGIAQGFAPPSRGVSR